MGQYRDGNGGKKAYSISEKKQKTPRFPGKNVSTKKFVMRRSGVRIPSSAPGFPASFKIQYIYWGAVMGQLRPGNGLRTTHRNPVF
jgi:hypothetical protein